MSPTSPDSSAMLHEQAGEYVLGTMPAAQRQAFEAKLRRDEATRAAVQAWEERLLPLTAIVDPVEPSKRLWHRIERSANAYARPAQDHVASSVDRTTERRRFRWLWNSLSLWRTMTAGACATAAVLAIALFQTMNASQSAPQFMVVLVAPEDKAPGWVIQAKTSSEIRLIPLAAAIVPQDKALQFWTKGPGWSGPVSLGLVKSGQSLNIPLESLPPLQEGQLFELTLEPPTGSPISKPTGPIQYIGRAVKVS